MHGSPPSVQASKARARFPAHACNGGPDDDTNQTASTWVEAPAQLQLDCPNYPAGTVMAEHKQASTLSALTRQ
jgi:hypothetical protein